MTILAHVRAFNPTEPGTMTWPFPYGVQPYGGIASIAVQGAEVTLLFSDDGFTSEPTDDPANAIFSPRLTVPFSLKTRLFEGNEPTGRAVASKGEIRIANADGELDNRLRWGFDGRMIEIKSGVKGADLASFSTVFTGTVAGIRWTESELILQLRDRQTLFDSPIGVGSFAGSGGLEGNADVEGRPYPGVYGKVLNVEATFVDPALLIYRIHDRNVQAIDAVYDQRVALTNEGDVADLTATSVTAGQFKTNLANGAFRLGAKPAGRVTVDAQGDSAGSYVSTTGDIVRRIAGRSGQVIDPDDIDTSAFTQLNTDFGHVVGIAIPAQEVDTSEIITALMAGAHGWWFFDNLGKLTVGQLKAPASPTDTIEARDFSLSPPLERTGVQTPSRARNVEWGRMWSVMGREDVAGAVSDADVALVSREARVAVAQDAAVRTNYALARDVTARSFIDTEANAQTEADRQLALHKVLRDVYRVELTNSLFRFTPGQVVTLKIPRFDLSGGKDMVVIGLEESAGPGAAPDRAACELWG